MEEQSKFEWIAELMLKQPAVAAWLITTAFMSVIYADNRSFIREQSETLKAINSTQVQIQVELRELNTRISAMEQQQKP